MVTKNTKKEINLGVRKVAKQNFSHMVAIPHVFVNGYVGPNREVECILDVSRGILLLKPIVKKEGRKKNG